VTCHYVQYHGNPYIGDPRRRTRHIHRSQPTNSESPAHRQQEHKHHTAHLRKIGCAGQTHLPAASPDFTLLRTIGCAGQTHLPAASPDLTHLRKIGCAGQTHLPAASPDFTFLRTIGRAGQTHLPAASPDLCATPDNQLPRTLTRLQLHRTTAHHRRPTTLAPRCQ